MEGDPWRYNIEAHSVDEERIIKISSRFNRKKPWATAFRQLKTQSGRNWLRRLHSHYGEHTKWRTASFWIDKGLNVIKQREPAERARYENIYFYSSFALIVRFFSVSSSDRGLSGKWGNGHQRKQRKHNKMRIMKSRKMRPNASNNGSNSRSCLRRLFHIPLRTNPLFFRSIFVLIYCRPWTLFPADTAVRSDSI